MTEILNTFMKKANARGEIKIETYTAWIYAKLLWGSRLSTYEL